MIVGSGIELARVYQKIQKTRCYILCSKYRVDDAVVFLEEASAIIIFELINETIATAKRTFSIIQDIQGYYLAENSMMIEMDELDNNHDNIVIDYAVLYEMVELEEKRRITRPGYVPRFVTDCYEDVAIGLMLSRFSDFFVSGFHPGNGKKSYYVMSNKPYAAERDNCTNNVAVTMMCCGYGDLALILNQLQLFIDDRSQLGKTIHIIAPTSNVHLFLHRCLTKCEVILRDFSHNIRSHEAILNSGLYEEVYHLPAPLINDGSSRHMLDIWSISLGYSMPSESRMNNRLLDLKLSYDIDTKLQRLKQEIEPKPIIGFQFYTSSDEMRSWQYGRVQEFVSLCKDRYNLICLTPHPYGEIDGLEDFSDVGIVELFPLIRQLDAFVGIDSCSGHIAGILGIPNLTLWGLIDPYRFFATAYSENYPISFRTFSMNYSLVPRDGVLENISGDLVFQRLQQIMNHEIKLKKQRITIEDTIMQNGIEKVGF
ncbi:hypothetical protein D3C74_148760 [compost metagenome]